MQAPTPPTEPIPPGQSPSPRKVNKTILLLSGSVLLVLVVSGILAGVLLPKRSGMSATSTPTVPAGFQRFSNSYFSIIYPQDWTATATDSPSPNGEQFVGGGKTFEVEVDPGGQANPTIDTTAFCIELQNISQSTGNISSPSTVTIGGEPWVRVTCNNFAEYDTVEEAVHHGTRFLIDYYSLTPNTTDLTQYYQPMEQSFAFLN